MLLPAQDVCGTRKVSKCPITIRGLSSLFSLPQFLKEAGFCDVQAEDRTAQFIRVIETELERAEANREEFIEVQLRVTATWPTTALI